jgi:GNAT superfamily N-acetyltransferase
MEASRVIIRKGTEADIDLVGLLWLDMVRELNPSYTPNIGWWKNITLGMMRQYKSHYLFVAEEAQDVVGFIDFFVVPEPATGCAHAVCRHLYVRPENRNRGVSNSLLRQYDESAKKEAAAVLELECGQEQHSFWQGKGFVPVQLRMKRYI